MFIEWAIPIWGWPLLLMAAVTAIGWTVRQYGASEPAPPPAVARRLIFLRSTSVILLLLALAGPSVFRIQTTTRSAEVVVVVEDSASMTLAAGREESPGPSAPGPGRDSAGTALVPRRWDRSWQLVAAAESLLQSRSEPVRITRLRGNGLEPARVVPGAGPELTAPVAVGTDLAALTREVGNRWAELPLRLVMVLGDGHDTVAGAADGYAEASLGSAAFMAVGVGDPAGPPDLAVQDLRYPDVAFQDDEIVVEVAVAGRNLENRPPEGITVRLRSGDRVVAEATTAAAAGSGVYRLELSCEPTRAGLRVFELEIEPLANERFLGNNKVTLGINVRKERARLLLLAGQPGWDSRFLAGAARSEERLELEMVYQGPAGLVFADSLEGWSTPDRSEQWLRWDGVILTGWDDVRHAIHWSSLAAAVHGGLGLLALAGDRGSAGAVAPPPAELAALLPVELQDSRWQPGDWVVEPDALGSRHPVLAEVVQPELATVAPAVEKLPPLVQVVEARPRPGSVPLLFARPRLPGGGPERLPLLAICHRGSGRVGWFGGRRLWEIVFWEAPGDLADRPEQPGRRLLRNLLVWCAAGTEGTGLALTGHRTVYQEGERVRLEAKWRDLRGDPVTERPVVLRLQPLDEGTGLTARTFSMTAVPEKPGCASVVLPPLPAGRYSVRPQAGGGESTPGREHFLVVSPHSLEATQVRQDRRRLRQLAASLGGSYLAAETEGARDRLAAALAEVNLTGDTQTTRRQQDIWAGWPLLGLVVILLGLEWYLRRRHGLL